jgi:hypothetical protein
VWPEAPPHGEGEERAYFLTLPASILIDGSSSFVENAVSTANGFSIVMLHGVVMHRLLNKKHGRSAGRRSKAR